jgi:hypothetical protein
MRLIDAEQLEQTLTGAINMMTAMAAAIGAEEDEGVQMELKAYKDILDGVKGQETINAITEDWIRGYIDHLKAMGVQLSLRDAQAVSVMVDKYMMEQYGNATCGPDYCDINFGGGTKV